VSISTPAISRARWAFRRAIASPTTRRSRSCWAIRARAARRIDTGTDADVEVYACARPGLRRAVVYRDSMAIPLIPLLSENSSRAVYVSSYTLDPALILREKPDIVI
jgi:hypothetical protein